MASEAETTQLLVRQLRWESQDVVSMRLENADGTDLPEWTPGAHVDLDLGWGLVRQYSLCGDPRDRCGYHIAVLREQYGQGSQHVHETLRPGHVVAVSKPRNNFALVESPRYLFLAGGIGITPIYAMIRQAEREGAEWELYYGGRNRSSMAFLRELSAYGSRVHVVAEDTDGILDLAALLSEPIDDTLVYTCGPEGLLGAVEEFAVKWPEGALQLERFKPKVRENGDPDADSPFQVVCNSSGIRTTVTPDCSIMEALEAAGLDVPNSCRDGICGTCETRVLSGTPDHRDSVLSSTEQSAGNTMMICVSRAKSSELVLDL